MANWAEGLGRGLTGFAQGRMLGEKLRSRKSADAGVDSTELVRRMAETDPLTTTSAPLPRDEADRAMQLASPGTEYVSPDVVDSSRGLKIPARSGRAALRRGLAGRNPIDANGAQIAVIQALADKVDRLTAQIKALKAQRKRGGR